MKKNESQIDDWIQHSGIMREQATWRLKRTYELQAKFLFDQYEPIKARPIEAGIPFIRRVDKWLANFDDADDRWSAYHSLRYFFFVGQQETEELYRCAVQQKLLPWLIDNSKLDIFSDNFPKLLEKELDYCWPCPISDSLRINSLLHRTNIDGQKIRPDWLSLKTVGDHTLIKRFIQEKKIKYLALFEDFSGSGRQCTETAEFALKAFPGPILLTPLVVCQPGHKALTELAAKWGRRLFYAPVIVLGEDCLVGDIPTLGEPASFASLRIAMKRGYKKGKFYSKTGKEFGYNKVGSLFSSYSNCPNNCPPIYHARTDTWPFPLFPRKGRV